ncbi:uncharacterized protein LOC123875850 [Maniola jurtina]|uniref:uncharacterized protein LOC123875850 n=1 Tax=Maniola jurtina TaxID=191418 RepID=UPI001E68B7C6|nr:uncharacterized protein LOC123875850 [Maniola jurtina]
MEDKSNNFTNIETVRVKVPPFWPDEPALWFAQLEGQFSLANVSADSTKYNYVVSSLEFKYITEIKDIVKNPPKENKYEKVKAELISRLSSSQEQRVRQLLTHEDIGDRKPSQFLRHLQGLAGPNVPDDFVRSLWAGRLPTHIQVIIASQPKSSLDELATLADTITDVIGTSQIHQLAAPPAPPAPAPAAAPASSEIKDLKRAITELTRQVAALASSPRTRSRSKSGDTRWRRRSRSQSHDDAASEAFCWYHRKFRENATKCRAPCTYTAENDKGSH